MEAVKVSHVHKKGKLSLFDILKQVRANQNFSKAGGIGIFVGVVRGETFRSETVSKLELEAYVEKANEVLANICAELRNRTGIIDVQIHHLIGEFDVGEDLVYVVVAGAHRHEMFSTLEEAVERYKKEAPIFKKEYIFTENGTTRSFWVSERE